MSWESWGDAAERGPGAIAWKVGCFVVVMIVVLGAVGLVFNPFRQAARIIEKTIDADNVIYNYEWFKTQWRAVRAIDKKIAAQQGAANQFTEVAGKRSDWPRDDRMEHARLMAVVTGLQQQRADMVAQYNARAAMANREIFMGDDCPDHLE